MRIAIFLSVLIFGCGTRQPTPPPTDMDTESPTSTQTGVALEFGPGDIFLNEASTTIRGNEISRATTFKQEVENLQPHLQVLKYEGIIDLTLHLGANTQSQDAFQVVYAAGQVGYQRVNIQTCNGAATLVLPEIGFQPDLDILMEQTGTRLRMAGKDLPPQPGCPESGPTFCSAERTQDLEELVKRVNDLSNTSTSPLHILLGIPEATPSQDLLDVLQLFAGKSPAIRAQISVAILPHS